MNPQDLWKNLGLSGISPEKLQFLMELAQSSQGIPSTPKDMAASLKNASESFQKEGVRFSDSEQSLIIEALKQGMPPQEQRKADLILKMMRGMRR